MLACLLPARNAAADIPGYLESAASFADLIVALDDGSTDETADLLEAAPLVDVLLRNPRRETYAGWDDADNRQRLLDAAIEAGADWVLFLDADERIDPEDGEALREFVRTDAVPGCAYGLRVFRTWGEEAVSEPTVAYRLFAAARGQALPARRLHFNPVPEEIPRPAWIPTTIRIRHLDSPDRLRTRAEKYAGADPGGEFAHRAAQMLAEPEGDLVAWGPRPAGLPVLAPAGEIGPGRGGKRPRLACLLPARNAAADIPGYLESAASFADLIVALDDGSTDETADLLEAAPLVDVLLRNPRRETYAGWDDADNRQRLLDAAIEAGADWVLFLDADERIDPEDGEALRRFVDGGADPECAYGFRVFRMVGDEDHYDRAQLWVYRLFAPSAGSVLPPERLHLVPVPQAIPRERWLKTTVRVKHLGSLTAERREARLAKYEQADSERRWQPDYSALVAEPDAAREWRRRPAGFPVLAGGFSPGTELDLAMPDLQAPLLSAIVISRNDEATIEASLRALLSQECPQPFEVILAVSGSDRTEAIATERFPEVTVVRVPEPGLPGAARNAGLAAARGEYASFPGSHVVLEPGSLAARIAAHEQGWAMVTGSILNGTQTRAGWASYFLDHSSSLPGRPSGPLHGAPAHCSYVREFLLEAGGFPEDARAGEDTVVNNELWRRGHGAYRAADVRLVHFSPCTNAARLVRHHFVRGRALGRILAEGGGRPEWRQLGRYLRGYAGARLRQTDQRVHMWGGELAEEYRACRPLVKLGIRAAWAGAWTELLRRRFGLRLGRSS